MTTDPDPPEVGTVYTHERTFTHEDVRQFGEVSGDQQPIHTEPNEAGHLVVQGLLTATLPTKIGGDLEFLASRMEYEFEQPVYTGETISCEWRNEEVSERSDRYYVTSSIVCTNDTGETVLTGEIDGIIWKASADG